jgi:hypothetical protein
MRAPMTNRRTPAVEHLHNATAVTPGPTWAGQRPHGTPASALAYQDRWTRLGRRMGYTNTYAKRAAIRAAVDTMIWVDPNQLADLLHAVPVRFLVAGLFFGRARQLHAAATTPVPAGAGPTAVGPDGDRRLIGLHSVTGDRYVLLDLGYEAIDLLHRTDVQPPRP